MKGVLQLGTCKMGIQTCLTSGGGSPLAKEYQSLHFLLRTVDLMQLNPFNMVLSRYCLNFMFSSSQFHTLYCFTKVREWFKISVSLLCPSQSYKSNSHFYFMYSVQLSHTMDSVWLGEKKSHICIAIVLPHSHLICLAVDTRYRHGEPASSCYKCLQKRDHPRQ